LTDMDYSLTSINRRVAPSILRLPDANAWTCLHEEVWNNECIL